MPTSAFCNDKCRLEKFAAGGGTEVYLRHAVHRKRGKPHTYWRLVRSMRRGSKVAQETVTRLSQLDAQGRAKATALARQITGRSDQRELFEPASAPVGTIEMWLDKIRLERRRVFGLVWLGRALWRAADLDAVRAELLPAGLEAAPRSLMAAVLVLARLCDP